jgi:hypothetical protein
MFSTPVVRAGFLLCIPMSDETAPSPEKSPKSEAAPRARRISTPRPKKTAKKAVVAESRTEAAAEIPSIPFPDSPPAAPEPPIETPAQSGGDWPEPEAATAGGNLSPAETTKRKRRRRKGKGQSAGPQNAGTPSGDEVQAVAESKPNEAPQEQRPRPAPGPQPQPQQRSKIDPELLTKMAWKIYLAEVSEEGVALIGDADAKDLSRRCFRLAEIFIEEQARRR